MLVFLYQHHGSHMGLSAPQALGGLSMIQPVSPLFFLPQMIAGKDLPNKNHCQS
jgi:hypothetical protein